VTAQLFSLCCIWKEKQAKPIAIHKSFSGRIHYLKNDAKKINSNKFAILESSVAGGSLNFQVELLHRRVGTCCLLLRFVYVVMERED
jgi:hypothetical protein